MTDEGFLSDINVLKAMREALLHNGKSFAILFLVFVVLFLLVSFSGGLVKVICLCYRDCYP